MPRPDEDELRSWVKQNLARYKVPREFVFIDELPRNATGKILKRELAQESARGRTDERHRDRRAGARLHAA